LQTLLAGFVYKPCLVDIAAFSSTGVKPGQSHTTIVVFIYLQRLKALPKTGPLHTNTGIRLKQGTMGMASNMRTGCVHIRVFAPGHGGTINMGTGITPAIQTTTMAHHKQAVLPMIARIKPKTTTFWNITALAEQNIMFSNTHPWPSPENHWPDLSPGKCRDTWSLYKNRRYVRLHIPYMQRYG
jgi:hypothetical protein